MRGSALLHTISFLAVVAAILLTASVVVVLESGSHRPAQEQQAAKPSDEPGDATAPEREAA
jgi:hypothetical protein